MEQDPRYASRNAAKSGYANFLKGLRNQAAATRAAQNQAASEAPRKPPPPPRPQGWVKPNYAPPPKGGKRKTRKNKRKTKRQAK